MYISRISHPYNSTGTVHRHGPRHNPCPGSDRPPVTVRPPVSCQNSITQAASPV